MSLPPQSLLPKLKSSDVLNEHLAKQLTDIYLTEEYWHDERLGPEEAYQYHLSILRNNQCLTVTDNEKLTGYCEFHVSNGVCFVANLFIRPEYRRGQTIKLLKNKLFEVAKGAKVYLGERNKFNRKFPEVQLRSQNG